jgi:hypothetical protein
VTVALAWRRRPRHRRRGSRRRGRRACRQRTGPGCGPSPTRGAPSVGVTAPSSAAWRVLAAARRTGSGGVARRSMGPMGAWPGRPASRAGPAAAPAQTRGARRAWPPSTADDRRVRVARSVGVVGPRGGHGPARRSGPAGGQRSPAPVASAPLASPTLSSGRRWRRSGATVAPGSRTEPRCGGRPPARPPGSRPRSTWRRWPRSRARGAAGRSASRQCRHPPGGLSALARRPRLPEARRDHHPAGVGGRGERPPAPRSQPSPAGPGGGVPGRHAPGTARRRSTPQDGPGGAPFPPGRGPRDRGPRSRPAAHATTAATRPLHPHPEHGAVGGRAREASAGRLASAPRLAPARPARQHRLPERGGAPRPGRSRPTCAAAATVAPPGDHGPYSPQGPAPSQPGRALAARPGAARSRARRGGLRGRCRVRSEPAGAGSRPAGLVRAAVPARGHHATPSRACPGPDRVAPSRRGDAEAALGAARSGRARLAPPPVGRPRAQPPAGARLVPPGSAGAPARRGTALRALGPRGRDAPCSAT